MVRQKPPRFYVPHIGLGRPASLPAEESRHLTRVLRLGVGDLVTVFDGSGREFVARVARDERGGLVAAPVAQTMPAAEPAVRLTVAQVILKADRMSGVVRDVTTLGATRIQPLIAGRSEVRPAPCAVAGLLARWQRVAVSATKQCGRAVVPDVCPPRSLAPFLTEDRSPIRVMLVEPGVASGARVSLDGLARRGAPGEATVLIGPEGGWTPHEIQTARDRGVVPVTLGPRTLRAETVPVVALAVLLWLWGDLS